MKGLIAAVRVRMSRMTTRGDLVKLGERAVVLLQDRDWERRFRSRIDRGVSKRIGDLPFLRQRGW